MSIKRSMAIIALVVALAPRGPSEVVVEGQETTPTQSSQAAAFTIMGDAALWTVAIRPDKTRDFETVMAKLHEALKKSSRPERQRQAAGWKLLKIDKPMPDGNIAYVHVINPVIHGADYTIMQILYDEFPDERRTLYDLYRGAFAQNLSLASGSIAADLSKPE